MSGENQPLILDLVEWVARTPRPYSDVMDAWRSSCPRLTIWEDAIEQGLVARVRGDTGTTLVTATARGRALLELAGRGTPSAEGRRAGA